MTNVAAAIGLAQLECIDAHLRARQDVAAGYDQRLAHLSDKVALPMTENWADHAYWMYTIRLQDRLQKKETASSTTSKPRESKPVLSFIHACSSALPRGSQGPFPRAEICGARGINVPTHGRLTDS